MNRREFTKFPMAFAFLALLFLLTCAPRPGMSAAEPFAGYPPDVRDCALRLLDAAKPGNEETLEREVQALRKAMLDYSIVSMNEIPDRIFERARREDWEGKAGGVLRPVTRVAPFSASLWAWLIRDDLSTFGIGRLFNDLGGFRGALLRYGPALIGCAAWLFLCVIAAASWFAVWTSVSLLLRSQPAITSDFARLFSKVPRPEIPAFCVFLACFLAPAFAGIGLGVAAVFWFFLSAGYLRRWEIAMALFSILLLSTVFFFGRALQPIAKYAGETQKGGWLAGEGYFPQEWPRSGTDPIGAVGGARWEEMVRFARARAEMQAGRNETAEALWTDWIRDAEDPASGYNNRGIVRQRLGKTAEALEDFEKAVEKGPRNGPAVWNSYQMYLRTFRLEDAARVQESAWNSLRRLSFFDYRAEEMTHGELVPSTLVVGGMGKALVTPRREWLRDDGESGVIRFLFRPLPVRAVPWFLALGALWMVLWKPLSSKIWMHGTCRSCGTRSLVVGGRESTDICNQCRAQIGGGIRAGEEREQRIQTIAMHQRYVRACSVAVPGAGALWAGKRLSVLLYGILLSLALGILTVSIDAESAPSPLISEMMKGISLGIGGVLLVLWAVGAVWSWIAFGSLQFKYNIVPRR